MKTNRLNPLLRAAACCLSLMALPSAWALDAGAPVPDIQLPGRDGTVSLAGLRSKVVYLDFWASWCGPCRQSFPFMNELMAKYGAQGLEVVAVNLDARREDADKFLTEVPAKFTLAFDAHGDSARRYQVMGMPSSYLIGRDGSLIALHKGFRAEDRQELEARIQQALAAR